MIKKAALHTLGCKLNFSETSTIGKQFLSRGFSVVDVNEKADVYLFNTCTVTENAERECRQLVRRALRNNPEAYIIVTGCYAQLRSEEIAAIDGVDAVLGSNEKFNLFSIIKNFEKKGLACIQVSSTEDSNYFDPASSTEADSRTRAFLKIQDGCDYNCSFCTIPLARGKSRSQPAEQLIQSFTNLVEHGYKEIILTGVNVGDYGKKENISLFKLLQKLIKIEGEFRIRISSIEPNLLTDDLIHLAASTEKICNHFHIPLQSGSLRILKAMQRRYSIRDYEELIYKLNSRINDVGIGVDVIVGFPGESEEDFIHTHNFLRDLPISYLHVFTYSERPDTKAINLPGSVDVVERKRRNNILRILSEKKRSQFYENMLGKELDVLFESENVKNSMLGFSSNYVRICNDYDEEFTNKLTKVEIKGIENGMCYGNILDIKNSIDLIPAIT
ncbi:MAG TPA: tRNA (N(6)-L-threonylcarbamoyladenosine(37)-C(2))-methylthiotransferase MtaB [Ignavibacteriaceae bacterium]|nr:tRNA (N(6)-L-threonylcarbamoyladenosine(37)-C(2))-methylthiotransferase MtaB [Ignavibacteriaceae bacterium]